MDSGASWTTIAMIMFVVVGCILTVFLGYLVRSAYDMRIGLKAQLDRGLRQVEENAAKTSRNLRQELGSDIERARTAIFEEARKRVAESVASIETRWLDYEKAGRQERVDTAVSLDALRDELAALQRRVDDLERELLIGGAENEPPVTPITPTSGSSTPSGSGGGGAVSVTPKVSISGTTTSALRFGPRATGKVATG
ncbi:MAG TPA: hypothetical protein VGG27_05940 [Magnetospirillaceae bacterium]|jgi:Tfp pilus assembly protein PilO